MFETAVDAIVSGDAETLAALLRADPELVRARSTTLMLTATSGHPEKAGVQIALMELLPARGTAIDGPDGGSTVNASLRNGRRRAAEFLADQVRDGLSWACEFGRTAVVEFLLGKGMGVNVGTGLHSAAFGGHADIVRILLLRGANVELKDERFGDTPLGWAVYAFREVPGPELYGVVALLVRAGADPEEAWYTGSDPRMIAALRGQSS